MRVVIFDNGSDPLVRAGMQTFIDQGVQWVGSEQNHPVGWNIERAIRSVDTPYFLMLHDDDRLCPNYLETQVGCLDAHPQAAAVSCNGYYITESGERTGFVLSPLMLEKRLEVLDCGGEVAIRYAGNSCVPFSPAMYRSEVARRVKFRKEFGKVCDAAYFCDLADHGGVIYLTEPLYEVRMHAGQDSSSFPIATMNFLEGFFETCYLKNEARRSLLQSLLRRQHTARNLKMIFGHARRLEWLSIPSLLRDPRFTWKDALDIIAKGALRWMALDRSNLVNRSDH